MPNMHPHACLSFGPTLNQDRGTMRVWIPPRRLDPDAAAIKTLLRGFGELVPELSEAAVRAECAYIATAFERNGQKKVVWAGHTIPEAVRAFRDEWAPALDLVGVYGDPAHKFAAEDA